MSSKKGLGRLYDRLSPEERFRLGAGGKCNGALAQVSSSP